MISQMATFRYIATNKMKETFSNYWTFITLPGNNNNNDNNEPT